MVLVDTSVWSAALRRARPREAEERLRAALAKLIQDGDVVMVGLVRQELLSGIRSPEQYERLRVQLRAFPDIPLETGDYEQAADYFNRCRARGIQGSSIDFLICATATRRDLAIFTTDRDFDAFARVVPIRRFDIEPRTAR